jgi:hypothetical protein
MLVLINTWWSLSCSCLLIKGLIMCSWISVTVCFLVCSSPVVWYCLPFHGFVCFNFPCSEFLGESFVVVALWSYIVLVHFYHGRLLLFHLFWMIVLLTIVFQDWSYFYSVTRRPHSMPFLLLMFLLSSLLDFDGFTFVCYLFFLSYNLQYSFFSLCTCCFNDNMSCGSSTLVRSVRYSGGFLYLNGHSFL